MQNFSVIKHSKAQGNESPQLDDILIITFQAFHAKSKTVYESSVKPYQLTLGEKPLIPGLSLGIHRLRKGMQASFEVAEVNKEKRFVGLTGIAAPSQALLYTVTLVDILRAEPIEPDTTAFPPLRLQSQIQSQRLIPTKSPTLQQQKPRSQSRLDQSGQNNTIISTEIASVIKQL